jgi:MoxR-like ATPase
MQERQVTVEGRTTPLEAPFHVLATANPIEYEGTYQLPEAQLDRFLLRVSFGYPSASDEAEILARRVARRREEQQLDAVTDAAGLREMQAAVEAIEIESGVLDYIVRVVTSTRAHGQILVGASPRGALAIMLSARAVAGMAGRSFVTPGDVKAVAPAALAHRLTLRPESYLQGASAEDLVRALLEEIPVPDTAETPRFETPVP